MSTDRPLCRHYHPLRYAWACGAGYRAPRDCRACTRYDMDPVADSPEDAIRVKQWDKAHQPYGHNASQHAHD